MAGRDRVIIGDSVRAGIRGLCSEHDATQKAIGRTWLSRLQRIEEAYRMEDQKLPRRTEPL